MKLIHKKNYMNYIIVLIALIAAAIVFPMLPEEIPTHFNAQGVPDSYGSPLTVFLLPGIMLFVNILAEVLKYADPKAANYQMFSKHYYLLFLVINIFLLLVEGYIISYSMDWVSFNISTGITIALGILFMVIGNFLPKVKQNFFMGIKTPWTLADEQVWYKTHRFAGKIWFVAGLILCLCSFLPSKVFVPVLLVALLPAAVVPMIYSYIIFKRP